MKTSELTAIGLTEEQATQVLAMNGKDIESAKAAKDKVIADLTSERDDYKERLETAETTLKGFEDIDPEKIQQELQTYKQKAEDAEKDFAKKILQRDQADWLKGKLDEYGVASPYARKQLITEITDETNGLKWKDGAFMGLDDYMKSAKEKDGNLYQTAEEKAAAEKAAAEAAKAPKFTGPTGDSKGDGDKFVPPKIF
jgi:DNA repair exonuclease SbcCD ATPase subunit